MRFPKFQSFVKKTISPILLLCFALASFSLAANLLIGEAYHPNADLFYFGFKTSAFIGVVFSIGFFINIIFFFIGKSSKKNIYTLWGFLISIVILMAFAGHFITDSKPDYFTHSIDGKSYEVPRHFTTSQNDTTDRVSLKIKGSIEKNEPIYGVYQPGKKRKSSSSAITLTEKYRFGPFEFNYIMYTASSTSENPYIKYIDKKVSISHVPDWLKVVEYEDTKTITNITDEILVSASENPDVYSAPREVLNAFYYMEVDKSGELLKFTNCRDLDSCKHHILYEDTVLSFSTYQDKEFLPNNLPDLLNGWEIEAERAKDLIDSFEVK